MKIGIITHYDVHNHGALLQLNALVQILSGRGHEVFALKFDKNYDFMGRELKNKYTLSVKSIPFYIRYLFKKGLIKTLYNIRKKRTLDVYCRTHHLIGEYYTEYENLDAVIIGSDEVFALHTGPTPVFWGHGLPSDKIISYAGCFGPTTCEDIFRKRCENLVKGGLAQMSKISVRDQNSKEIVRKLTGAEVQVVCDPVILYGYVSELSSIPHVSLEKYLIVYAYDESFNSEDEISMVRAYAKTNGLKIVSPGFYHKWVDININATPVEVLAYFRDAELVITDTFHGCVMSLISGTDMVVKVKESNENKLGNLCREYGIEDRILSVDNSLCDIVKTSLDWNRINLEISHRRALSDRFLCDGLGIKIS